MGGRRWPDGKSKRSKAVQKDIRSHEFRLTSCVSIAQPEVGFERGTSAVGGPARRPRHLRGVLRVVSERTVHLRLGEAHAQREAVDCHVGALARGEERAPLPARLTPAE